MNQAELSVFAEPDRPKMCGPFSFGDYSYATNGHILVRVPRAEDVPEWDSLNEQAARMFEKLDYPALTAALVDIPDYPQPEPVPCIVCKGAGKITTCPECEGSGYVEFENDHNDYECGCKTCHGAGRLIGRDEICDACNGTGKKKEVEAIAIGRALLSSHYLDMLKELPGIKIAPTEPDKANYFKWDEGDGLLMPMRA